MIPEDIYEKMKVIILYIIGEEDGKINLGWEEYELHDKCSLKDKQDYCIIRLVRSNKRLTYIFSTSSATDIYSGILENIIVEDINSSQWRSFKPIHNFLIEGDEELFGAISIGFADSIIEKYHNSPCNIKLKITGGNYNGED